MDGKVKINNSGVRVTAHAVERYLERVDRRASWEDAAHAILRIVSAGHARPKPRHWTTARPEPGTTYIYEAEHPDTCLVVKNRAVVTLLTRDLCRSGRLINAAA